MGTKLRVRAAGVALVPDQGKPANHPRRFVGRELAGVTKEGVASWAPIGDVEIEDLADYRAALKAGDLEPADEETAKAVGLEWEPAHAAKPHERPAIVSDGEGGSR